jgi:hypothetical protein
MIRCRWREDLVDLRSIRNQNKATSRSALVISSFLIAFCEWCHVFTCSSRGPISLAALHFILHSLPSQSIMASSIEEKPVVFVLCLDHEEQWEGLFDQIYPDQIASLTEKYRIVRARKPDAAQRYLSNSQNKPIAILITDPGAVNPSNAAVLNLVKEYVQKGGIAVFMASFSSFMRPDDMDKLWKEQWGLNWRMGDYHRTDVYLNRYVWSSTQGLILESCPIPIEHTDKISQGYPVHISNLLTGKLQPEGGIPQERVSRKCPILAFTTVQDPVLGLQSGTCQSRPNACCIHQEWPRMARIPRGCQ